MRARYPLTVFVLLLALFSSAGLAARRAAAQTTPSGIVTLPGHVLPALAQATKVTPTPQSAIAVAQQPLTLAVVLQRSDEAGFEAYLKDIADPKSPNFGHYLDQATLTARFGPSQQAYDAVSNYLTQQGFKIVGGSANRLTLTVSGSRSEAQAAFQTAISDYQLAGRTFYANDTNPAVPAAIAPNIAGILGLNNLARPQPAIGDVQPQNVADANTPPATTPQALTKPYDFGGVGTTGAGQKIGLLEFDNYQTTDVQNWIQWTGATASISQLSHMDVAGGMLPSMGGGTTEAMLDIETVMGMAPGANYVVYDAPISLPANLGFEVLFNAMINDNDTVISNSWFSCEAGGFTTSDVQTVDSILAQAAASGIAVFGASGDSGQGCKDSAGTYTSGEFPQDSIYNTVVGGTVLSVDASDNYASEAWWNNGASGAGGYWTSSLEPAPAFQSGFASGGNRQAPDVSADSGDGIGIVINGAHLCCYAGTSEGTPEWAAGTALIYQKLGHRLGDFNARLYALAPSNAFHSAASMGSDFTHVGLGSFDLGNLYTQLNGAPGCGGTTATPELAQPNAGATLTSSSQTFCWTQAAGVTGFQLQVGTQGVGSSDLFNQSFPATTTSATVSNIPAGYLLFVRLSWTDGGGTHFTDYEVKSQPVQGSAYWFVPSGCVEFAAASTTPAGTTIASAAAKVQFYNGGSVLGIWKINPATETFQAGYIAASGAPVDITTYGPGDDLEVCTNANNSYAELPATSFTLTGLITTVPMARFYGTASGPNVHDFSVVNVWVDGGATYCGTGSVKGGSYFVDLKPLATDCATPGATVSFSIDNTAVTGTSVTPVVPNFPGGGVQVNLTAGSGSYTLTINSNGCGSTSPSGSSQQYQYLAGNPPPPNVINVTATPCDGSHTFQNWTITGAACNGGTTANPCTFNMPGNNVTLTANFIPTPPPGITSPADGATLSGPSQTFTWNTTGGATGYWLWVGTHGAGSYNISAGQPLSASTSSTTINNLPTSGTINVRFWYQVAGAWQFADYSYTGGTGPGLTVGVNGCGTTSPSGFSQPTVGSPVTVTATPCDGSHPFLSWTITGASCTAGTTTNPCQFTMPNGSVTVTANFGGPAQSCPPAITTPPPGSTLSGTSVTFQWTPCNTATGYWLWVGTQGAGSHNITGGQQLSASTTSYTVNGLPTSGTIYVRFYYQQNGNWNQYIDYTYTGGNGGGGSTYTLTIATSGAGAGCTTNPAPGATQHAQGDPISITATTCAGYNFSGWTLTGISGVCSGTTNPCAFTMPSNAVSVTANFVASGGNQCPPAITTPPPGNTLSGTSATFQWAPCNTATGYWLWVGTTGVGSYNITNGQQLSASTTSYTVNGLPTSGTIYVRFWYQQAGTWKSIDYTYTGGP